MQVVGVSMVRNEASIIAANVLYHLANGIDRFIIRDNDSSDDTPRILRDLEKRTGRVTWSTDRGPFNQSSTMTELARRAAEEGADWIVPIDGDEFWHADAGLKATLSATPAAVLYAPVVNFVQRRSQLMGSPDELLTMTWRVEDPVGPIERCQEFVEGQIIGFVEMEYPAKVVSRPSPTIELRAGNHGVAGVTGAREHTKSIEVFHAPVRSYEALERRIEHGRRVEATRVDRHARLRQRRRRVRPRDRYRAERPRGVRPTGCVLAPWMGRTFPQRLRAGGGPHRVARRGRSLRHPL